ncbi:MAG: hypothetical protein RLZZ488_2663 [Pseudomonadota bacterium]
MIDLNRSWMFLEVARSGSFTAAAKTLGIPKSTLSEKITALEESLGTTLIVRTTRSLRLTDAGHVYARMISVGLEQILLAKDEIGRRKNIPSGKIKVSLLPNLANSQFPEKLAGFLNAYPDVTLELDFSDRVVNILEEGFDICVRAGHSEDSSLRSKRIRRDRSILVCSQDYAKRAGVPATITELRNHQLVNWNSDTSIWDLEHQGRQRAKIKVKSRLFANNVEAVMKIVSGGFGIALLPSEICTELLQRKQLVQVLPQWGSKEFFVYIVYPAQKQEAAKLKAFMPWLERALKNI